MTEKTIIINGNNFSDLETFYDEIDRVLTKNLTWRTGHNLNAFNDLLRGGFGVHEYEEPVKIVWTNFKNSESSLGKELIYHLRELILHHKHVNFTTED